MFEIQCFHRGGTGSCMSISGYMVAQEEFLRYAILPPIYRVEMGSGDKLVHVHHKGDPSRDF